MKRPSRRTVVLTAVVLLLGIVGAFAGVVVDQQRGPVWSADTGILIRMASPDTVLLTGLAAEVGTEDLVDAAAVAKSQEVLTRAATQLGPSVTWTGLAADVTVEPVGASHILKVTAKAPTRDAASRMADAVAAAYVGTTEERIRSSMATLETVPRPPDPQRQGGSDVTADVRSRAVILGRDITVAETFRTAEPTQISPSTRTPIELGIVGLGAGALFAVILTLLRPASRRRPDPKPLPLLHDEPMDAPGSRTGDAVDAVDPVGTADPVRT